MSGTLLQDWALKGFWIHSLSVSHLKNPNIHICMSAQMHILLPSLNTQIIV